MDKQKVINFCAEFWQVDPTLITEDLKIDDKALPNNSSIRFYQFMATVEEHFDVRINNINDVATFGDLFKNLEKGF
ncbi:MAG: hypothetical protein Q8R37_05860 [Nanoarchaeota archaeon]|nr:hypothetical protein [Nanoarchaeota archaeon]